ncbi:polycomb group protein Psc-like [Copidosoma floridanum]|uniref:polycomb group protein Psc-like n=1 Tax=Copidosoma floridanum TaxID=29053 RepID=UPI0006C9C13C|nr:polycomb group protein Psc-like [Copidosoma floridanum]
MAGISGKRTYLREVNPHLICPLCVGYLIDATTVVECLHSFCRSCILKHLTKNAQCPVCKHLLNTAKPNIKADKTLQDIVYKLVPGLYHKEMRRRREFYSKHPEHGLAARQNNHLAGAEYATPEQRGEDVSGRLIFAPEDAISLSLEYLPTGADPLELLSTDAADGGSANHSAKQPKPNNGITRRYLQCPALVTIAHLKKFLALKYVVDVTKFNIDICHRRAPLPEHWTLMDVAYIFAWKRNAPIRFFYRITPEEQYLEAPPNDRPSTPGLGASQPVPIEQASESNETKPDNQVKHERPTKPAAAPNKVESPPKSVKPSDTDKSPVLLAKRSSPKEATKSLENKPSSRPDDLVKQVKSPLKIAKNSDGRYQVLQGPSVSAKDAPSLDKPVCKSPPAEFSVVSIKDSPNSNGFKITLKQCSPGTANATPNNNSSAPKKPKVISNVLLSKTDKLVGDELHKPEKQKRKVHFGDADALKAKKPTEQTDKKQFLHSFRLTAKQVPVGMTQPDGDVKHQPEQQVAKEEGAVEKKVSEEQKGSGGVKSENERGEEKSPPSAAKKRPGDAKTTSTNIADRLGEAKPATDSTNEQHKQKPQTPQQQAVDVYAFPNDPPAPVPPGAVKRKSPPGHPAFDSRKKQQQQQVAKKTGSGTPKPTTPVKCYRNQTKPSLYAKPSPNHAKQNLPMSANGNVTPATSIASPAVSSTSPKKSAASAPLISNDTRNLLDGCGLNIPASLSITLTSPKLSPNLVNESPDTRMDPARQTTIDSKLNPSITLNDRSVDPRVLKALKSGQMRMSVSNVKGKPTGRPRTPEQQKQPPAKRKKEEPMAAPAPPKNILDLSGSKKMDLQTLKIPIPHAKNMKIRPIGSANWPHVNNVKPGSKDDLEAFPVNRQVVTLASGQRYYRAPPGSLTPAAHRISDMPMPSRVPVYAPSVFSNSPMGRPAASNFSVFPSLQSLYALNQSTPTLEQFHMENRLRLSAANKESNNQNNIQVNKSHLAAQCAPVKPTRTFAVPIAKQSVAAQKVVVASPPVPVASKPPVNTTISEGSETTSSTTTDVTSEQKINKSDSSKEALPKAEPAENCASSTDEKSSPQDAASPRVTSTASPSPPPSVSDSTTDNKEKPTVSSEPEKCQSTTNPEEASINKSPESPDSSSVVTESVGNLVDSTKPSIIDKVQVKESSTENSENKVDEPMCEEKKNVKVVTTEPETPTTSEAWQKRFLAAFPSNEWSNAGFGNFLKSLSAQAEAQSKNTKTVE